LSECQNSKTRLSQDLEAATEYMAALEDKLYQSNKLNLDLL
jgi:CYTH domain-containing protein